MCGIIGYCGPRKASPIILDGLKRLEYRGYDSAGLSVGGDKTLRLHKKKGKIRRLREAVPQGIQGTWGIGHTRWATHGVVNDQNAHPHLDSSRKIAVVHNGIIENYSALKEKLLREGAVFHSETDSEVIVHLIASFYEGDLENAVKRALTLLKGTYGVIAIHADHPDLLVGARNGSPLVLGLGEGEMLLASDVSALAAHTRQVIYFEDGEVVALTPGSYAASDLGDKSVDKVVDHISWELEEMEKGDFPHYMIKEIHDQKESIPRACRGRLDNDQMTAVLGGLDMTRQELLRVGRIKIISAGTSYYAGSTAASLMEQIIRIPVSVELAAEIRYRNPIIESDCLYMALTQSGETLDTLTAMRELQRKGARVLGICNVVGSTISRESNGGVYIHSGPEIAVASTKAFTSQLATLYLFALHLSRMRDFSWSQGKEFIHHLNRLPEQVEDILGRKEEMQVIARKYAGSRHMFFLGRGLTYPVAQEGALKLKEVAYIHAEGYSAAEIKHGPIALINQEIPSLFLVPQDHLREKIINNIKEVKARGGPLIALAVQGDEEAALLVDDIFYVPDSHPWFAPFSMVIPLQLLAYYTAVELGLDVDQPRNLAKSVTVE